MEASMNVRRIVIAGAAALTACGVLGMAPAEAQQSSASGPAWTRQHPPAHPPGRNGPAMAYDAATGTVVLFGGGNGPFADYFFPVSTWTWG
jgi:hypothetical protein